jgi:hypothetical protein
MVNENNKAASATIDTPANMTIYRPNSVYQKLCLCDYLRELSGDPVDCSEGTDNSDPPVSTRQLTVGP